jgi:PilZ domain
MDSRSFAHLKYRIISWLPSLSGQTAAPHRFIKRNNPCMIYCDFQPLSLPCFSAIHSRLQLLRETADKAVMERRFDQRHAIGAGLPELSVHVTDLAKPERRGNGHMTDISESGMGVIVPFELASGDIVQIDVDDSTLFGFVMHAQPEGSRYRAGIELQRVLMGGSDLSRVLHLALRRSLPELPGVLAQGLGA